MRPPRAVFFDLDDTLLDGSSQRSALQRTCQVVAAELSDVTADRLLAVNQQVWNTYGPDVADEWTLGLLDSATVTREAWRRTLHRCGSPDEALARFAAERHGQYLREAYRAFDDAHEVVGRLAADLPCALITNGAAETQREKLAVTGMAAWFRSIVISGELGVAKPDVEIFRRALDALATPPEDAWHVGDDLARDVGGANAAGLIAIWLNRKGVRRLPGDPEPDAEIASLTELLSLRRDAH